MTPTYLENRINEDILAMQRPSSRLMSEFGLVAKFQDLGIGAIFNLQEPGEHAMCGDGLVVPEGFSYSFEDWSVAGSRHRRFVPLPGS